MDPGTVESATEFRSEFGFPSDPATIADLLASKTTDYSFGAPLTVVELKNMTHRLEVREAAEPALAFVAAHPTDFGGAYFTQDTGDVVLHILATSQGSNDVFDKVSGLLPSDLETHTDSVAFSAAALREAADRLSPATHPDVRQVGLEIVHDGLEVVLRPGVSSAALTSTAGVPVTVSYGEGPTPATCTNASSCTPYRGGIGIYSPQANEFCTWGFYGTRGTAAKYIITAGHCARVGDTESHLSVVFSDPVDRNTFQMANQLQQSDSMTAHVLGSANAVSPFNTIFASGTDKAHTITAQRSTGSQVVGDPVCYEGAHTGTQLCGTIEATGLSYTLTRFDGKQLTLANQIRMSRVTQTGDSGGPVYQSHTAYGVLNALAGGTAHMLYSTITNVEADMGNTIICLTSSC